jgi:hypothetical protein
MNPRTIVTELLLFLSPFAAYALYLWARGHGWREPEHWRGIPLAWLVAAGILVVAASLAYTALTTGDPIGGVYVPAHMEDGRLVPGRTEPRP